MKKISSTIILLSGLFILTGCGTSNEDEATSIESSVVQSDTPDSSGSQDSKDSSSSTPENVINSEEEAFNFIKEELGIEADDTDIVYSLLDSDEESYTLRLVSQSLQEQGGSGTAGLYKVYKDGTYEEEPN